MIDFPPQKLQVVNSWLKLQIFEKQVPKNVAALQGCFMSHIPRNERETSHQSALVGKGEGIRHLFVSCAIRYDKQSFGINQLHSIQVLVETIKNDFFKDLSIFRGKWCMNSYCRLYSLL